MKDLLMNKFGVNGQQEVSVKCTQLHPEASKDAKFFKKISDLEKVKSIYRNWLMYLNYYLIIY